MHKLWFDVETGGKDCKIHPLLTAYFAIYDGDDMIDELYLQLKPEDPANMIIQQEAMDVTGIDLEEHLKDPQTITYKEGGEKLLAMLEKNKIKGKRKHYTPCGHNVQFDKDFIWEQMVSREDFEKTVHYRTLDTFVACAILIDWGLLPADLGSLGSLVEYLEVPKGEAHNARGDILMNVEVYKRMRALGQSIKKNVGVSTNSLLQIIEE